jgi:selenide,water dikinase
MGAEGAAAVAVICLPTGDERQLESDLEQMLRGALARLTDLGIPLVGGHTVAGEQALIGFAMHGFVDPQRILRKGGAAPGDALVLSKPLGTGVVLAAARAGSADSAWTEATHRSMLRANRAAMRLLLAHAVRACTDVSGFGLAGHLAEMLRAGKVAARLHAAAIPALPGARELLDNGWRSSFHAINQRAQEPSCPSDVPPLLIDPQTSGGLLAAIPAEHLPALRAAAAQQGEDLFVIGEITGADSAHPAGSLSVET